MDKPFEEEDSKAKSEQLNNTSGKWFVLWLLLICSVIPLFLFITTPMDVAYQTLLGVFSVAIMVVMSRVKPQSRLVSLFLMAMSLLVSTRYMYWRASETLVFESGLEYVLGYGLFAAELYAWLILFLGYLQTAMPLERRITPLPKNTAEWPTVDVYIPSYNESLSVVADTVLAAQCLEYPADKLRVYLLDDGRRDAFAAFAARAGVGYITRNDNQHAKAGNLNNALAQTDGDLVAVFDCDHVPTCGFLQYTVGGFLKDENLSLLQTPHYFYSPDPFERNLAVGDDVPRESALFYGPVQQGNDFWNATFFCGSCAVIRRTALQDVEGFAVETVTEDAHTALKMQRKGWGTAYLGLPLAAGLATERLSVHIGQRARWARGMMQILRTDNPLFGRGLSFAQRLCYLSAMLHFQFPLPRVVFITAPLAYLLIGQNIIASSAEIIIAYALPHLVHAVYTNSRTNGRFRHIFWGEIYESVLAFQLVRPTMTTLLNPNKGKFNVTDKGALVEQTFFDIDAVKPQLIVAFLLLASVGWGLVRLYWHDYYDVEPNVMLLNVFWAGFSLFTLLAAIAVARERQQSRVNVRIDLQLPVSIFLEGGHALGSELIDISMGGVRLRNRQKQVLPTAIECIELIYHKRRVVLPVTLVSSDEESFRLRFGELDTDQRRQLVSIVMGRENAWFAEQEHPSDHPLRSFVGMLRCILGLFAPRLFSNSEDERQANSQVQEQLFTRWVVPLAMLVLFSVLLLLASLPAMADTVDADGYRARELALGELGGSKGLYIRGSGGRAGTQFSLPRDEVVRGARFDLLIDYFSPNDYGDTLILSVNGVEVGRAALELQDPMPLKYSVEVNPAYLVSNNNIDLALVGSRSDDCDVAEGMVTSVNILPTSRFLLTTDTLPTAKDLSLLPRPFFDPNASGDSLISMVLPARPSREQVRSAAILASWIGAESHFRTLSFSVGDSLPAGHAIVFATNEHPVPGISKTDIEVPAIRLTDNPNSTYGSLLVIEAPDDRGLIQAARYLASQSHQLMGRSVKVSDTSASDDTVESASRWVDTSDVIELGELVEPNSLRVSGLTPPLITMPFRLSPSMNLWPGRTVPLRVKYQFPEGEWLDVGKSHLDITLNGGFLRSLPVNRKGLLEQLWGALGGQVRQEEKVIHLSPERLHGKNELTFYFNLQAKLSSDCRSNVPDDVVSHLMPETNIDLSELRSMVSVPDLSLFTDSGYPFTSKADMSNSALVLPAQPDKQVLAAAFELIASFSEFTGKPALNLAVALGGDQLSSVAGRHWLALAGTSAPITKEVLKGSRLFVNKGRLRVAELKRKDWIVSLFLDGNRLSQDEADRTLNSREYLQALVSTASRSKQEPDSAETDVLLTVLLTATDSFGLVDMVKQFDTPNVFTTVSGDLSVLDSGEGANSYRLESTRLQGDENRYNRLRWWFAQRPFLLLILPLLIVSLLVAQAYTLLVLRAKRRRDGER
ncbi:Cellulose synthase 1 [Zhongshania aliphaticivorans]|uniref:Cellulose synthase catalytic subunit [UDP-forming] n=1 Tax=Zhongshania aliphaticivorans TaxID=1470434 RepID=A0A5S9P2W2_9GAMM|nr:UDP-forming cellulose synthase catalytic subunit [Zhongshania aliphaticivorans]CAA0090267.1 Cellulose synthase 1 [Zhongshania aliphaticivorans]CAA0097675.1 Cellulose synthase 1 [Zhongshania aliphaticivorans]